MHMGENGVLRLHSLDPHKRLADREMTRVRRVAQRIDNPHIEILQMLERLLWEIAHVRRISEPAEAKAERLAAPVNLPEGKRLDHPAWPLKMRERARRDLVAEQDRRIVAAHRRLEAIIETLA